MVQKMTPRVSTDKTQQKREMSVAAPSFFTLILQPSFHTGKKDTCTEERAHGPICFHSIDFLGGQFSLQAGGCAKVSEGNRVRVFLTLREIWAYRGPREQLMVGKSGAGNGEAQLACGHAAGLSTRPAMNGLQSLLRMSGKASSECRHPILLPRLSQGRTCIL